MSTPDLRLHTPSPPPSRPLPFSRSSFPSPSVPPAPPSLPPSIPPSLQYRVPRTASVASSSLRTTTEPTPSPVATPSNEDAVFPHIENYDPTYGMRPEGVPIRSNFGAFKRLWTTNRGLADLAEEAHPEDVDGGSVDAFDLVSWDDLVPSPQTLNSPSLLPTEPDMTEEYEAIPAVGGGVVMRPRIVHAQSRQSDMPTSAIQSPLSARPSMLTRSLGDLTQPGLSSLALRLAEVEANPARQLFPRAASVVSSGAPSMRPPYRQDMTLSAIPRLRRSSTGGESSYFPAMPTPPPSEVIMSDREDDSQPQSPLFPTRRPRGNSSRRRSVSPLTHSPRAIVLRPGLNDSVSQLGTLSQLNQTLSPYTRTLEHVTVRSIPRSTLLVPPEKAPQRARRKRQYRIGRKAPAPTPDAEDEEETAVGRERSMSPAPPSDFDASDRDHYFRQDPPLIRRRVPFNS